MWHLRILMNPATSTSIRYESNMLRPDNLFDQTNISQLVFSMQVLFIIVVFSCKVAASLLIHRLTCHKTQRIYALAIVTVSVVCCFVSMMLLSVGLGSSEPWAHQRDKAETMVGVRSSDSDQSANANAACIRLADGSYTRFSPTSSTDALLLSP